MATHTSATVREQASDLTHTPHVPETTRTATIMNALKRRAQAVLKDESIDAQSRAIIRYGLETHDPWLAELVRRAERCERVANTVPFSQTIQADKDGPYDERLSDERLSDERLSYDRPSNDEPSNDEPSNDEPSNDEPSNDGPGEGSNDGPSNDGTNNDGSTQETIEALAEIICSAGDEAAGALFVLMGTLQHSEHPQALANTAKHLAFTRCGELNLFGMVDAQIAAVKAELFASSRPVL